MPKKIDKAKRNAWRKKIDDWNASSLSMQKWCLQNGENYHTFKYWRQVLKEQQSPPIFHELTEEEPKLDIELSYDNLKILFPRGCTREALESCLKVLKDLPCLP